MAKEEISKQRIHIDLVGATSMGTTLFGKPSGKKDGSDAKGKRLSKTKDKQKEKAKSDNSKNLGKKPSSGQPAVPGGGKGPGKKP